MTSQIEMLKAAWEEARRATETARRVEVGALDALDEALKAWAQDDLIARGIVAGVTPVEVGHKRQDGSEYFVNREPVVVSGISVVRGTAYYETTRLTKGGKMSKGYNASSGRFPVVRPWVAK